MKKWLILLGVAFVTNGYSQTVFAPVGAVWTYYFETDGFPNWKGLETIRVLRDTIFESRSYKLIERERKYIDNRFADSIRIRKDNYYMRVSNDSIFFKFLLFSNEELLYFTYNTVEGDSIKVLNRPDPNGDNYFVTQKVEDLLINNNSFRVWSGMSDIAFIGEPFPPYKQYPTRFVERLGPLDDFFIYYAIEIHWTFPQKVALRCYYDNEVGLINFSSIPCDFLSSADNIEENTGNVFNYDYKWQANSNTINLVLEDLKSLPAHFKFFDIGGRILFEAKVDGLQSNISLPYSLINGIYFIQISDNEGRTKTKKVSIVNP